MPACGSTERRVAQYNGQWTAYRCRLCARYHTILTNTVFEKTRQSPSKIVLILRGVAQGQPTARLGRELGIGRQRMHEIRKQVQSNLHYTLPRAPMDADQVLETDELYQNAGKKGERHLDPDDPPRRRANKRPGHGSYETDRPPIFTVKGRESGLLRCFVRNSSGIESCLEVVGSCVSVSASTLNTDE